MFLRTQPGPRAAQGNARGLSEGKKHFCTAPTARRVDSCHSTSCAVHWSTSANICTRNAQRNGVATRGNYTKPVMWYKGARMKPPGEACCNVSVEIPTAPPPPAISKPDEAFAAAGMEFVWGAADIDIKQLNNLFDLVNFPRRDENKLRIALEKTHTTLWIRSTKQSRWAQKGQILGFARATSDSNLTATIWDVSVHPAWQRQGAEPHVVLLYERLGFQKDVKSMKGMGFATRSPAGQQDLIIEEEVLLDASEPEEGDETEE